MNVISPDNFEKKVKELRFYLFGEKFKLLDECIEQDLYFDPEIHVLRLDNMNREIIEFTAFNLFKKA